MIRYRELKQHIRFRVKNYSFFSFKLRKSCIIALFDDKVGKFGIADRLRHCLSIYLYCKENNYPFKIHHIVPFKLNHILLPNQVDWVLRENDFSKSIYRTKTIKIKSYYKSKRLNESVEAKDQLLLLSRFILSPKYQYHIYGNAHFYKRKWREAFDELFIPSKDLMDLINGLLLPSSYEAVTFRFQQLLGDFEEDGFSVLSPEEQSSLIEKCVQEIDNLKNRKYFKTDVILVTSDSVKFLNRIKQLEYVRVIDGERVHPAASTKHSERAYLNSFIDLYALRKAERVTLLKTGKMYLSGFPEFAAEIGNGKFEIHLF